MKFFRGEIYQTSNYLVTETIKNAMFLSPKDSFIFSQIIVK